MTYSFLDTSAILAGALKEVAVPYISALVLSELENIKTSSNKDEHIKYQARQAVRDIIDSKLIHYNLVPDKKIKKIFKEFDFLRDINDHKILAEAIALSRSTCEQVKFITCDGALYLIAKQIPDLIVELYEKKNLDDNLWSGWGKYYPTENELNMLYNDPKINTLKCKTNEFAEIYINNELTDILFWNGTTYRPLKYKEFTSTLGEHIKPRNLEQKMYLDLLQNQEIPVKLCVAKFGTGKSFLALSYALREVQRGRFDKIVFIKNNLEVKGAGKLGTLPGSEIEKQAPWLRQIEDCIGTYNFEELLQNGQIEPAHLSTLRGRDLKNCVILVDEAENLLSTNIQLLLGRVAENTEIIFCADVKQCDYKEKEMSGIPLMIERLGGNKLFGMVKLLKTERSPTAALADLLD